MLAERPIPYPQDGNGPYRLLHGFSQPVVKLFLQSLHQPEQVQAQRVQLLSQGVAQTAFGHDFSLTAGSDLKAWRGLPIQNHAQLLPYLERVAAGEPKVLTQEAVQMLLETSGTSGRPKWLPVTASWAASVAAAQRLWVLGLVRDDEALAQGSALSVVSPAQTGVSGGGLAVGSNTGRMFLAQPWWVRWRAPVPYRVYLIKDPLLRSYVILRHALAADIRSWTSANPSTLLLYCRHLKTFYEDLCRDCADGTLKHGPAAALSRWEQLRLGWGAGRRRLGAEPLPAKIWNLRRINCWTGGSANFFLDRLTGALGASIPLREVGITASEGFFAVPVDDGDPVAWLGGHLLEFIDAAGQSHLAWELETGQEYRLVISTEAGLYRYDLEDRVRVTGWLGRLPRLRFVGRSGNVLSATGEKVTEEQVALACKQAFPQAVGASACLGWGEVPWMRVALEGAVPDAVAFDRALKNLNVEYESKRDSGRLAMPEVRALPAGALARYKAQRVAAGAAEAQVKDPWVLSTERWQQLVDGHD